MNSLAFLVAEKSAQDMHPVHDARHGFGSRQYVFVRKESPQRNMPKRGLPVDRMWTIVKVSGEAYLRYIATDKIDQVMKDLEQKYQLVQIVGTLTSNKRSASGVVLQFLCDHPECEPPYENLCAICSGPYSGL